MELVECREEVEQLKKKKNGGEKEKKPCQHGEGEGEEEVSNG